MQSHFGVEDSKAEEVKRLVRSYPSMRFESNPWSIGGRTYFRISGDVHEFNDFQMKLYESERAFQQSVKYWQDKLEAEEKERGLTPRAADAGCDVCRDGVPGWDEEWLFCPYCGSTLRR